MLKTFARATEPHFRSLAAALEPVLHQFTLRYDKGTVSLEADFAGTTDVQIQALIDAAPVASPVLDVKAEIDRLPTVLQAIILSIIDAINVERQQHGRAAITKAMAFDAVKAKVDTL